MDTFTKVNISHYNYAVIKDSEISLLGGKKNLATILINTFDKKWTDLKPMNDHLLKDVILEETYGKIKITGTKIIYFWTPKPLVFNKRLMIVDEYDDEDLKKWSKLDVVAILMYMTGGKITFKEDDIKIGYDGLWNRIRGKRSYFINATKEAISAMERIALSEINEESDRFIISGWYQTTYTENYSVEATNYRIERNIQP